MRGEIYIVSLYLYFIIFFCQNTFKYIELDEVTRFLNSDEILIRRCEKLLFTKKKFIYFISRYKNYIYKSKIVIPFLSRKYQQEVCRKDEIRR